jgi:hydrogenase maturation protein HypF
MKPSFTELNLSSFHPSWDAIAFGADSKNTVSIVDKNKKLLTFSDNHGSLSEPESAGKFEHTVSELLKIGRPEILAIDLHPDYYSTVYGEKIAKKLGIPVLQIQHHHAHAISCMAEHGLNESLALVFDGTGYGTDGNLWGAELLLVDLRGFKRIATFAAAPLPGGDASVREPLRQLFGRTFFSNCHDKPDMNTFCKRYALNPDVAEVWLQQLEKKINCPLSHSAGRLFDSVSVLLGCAPKIAHEAEAAINLQKAAETCKDKPDTSLMPFKSSENDGMLFIDWSPVFFQHNINFSKKNLYALSFHHSLALAALKMAEFGIANHATRNIILSGGVFMNKLLMGILKSQLEKSGLKIFTSEIVPTNDCGISAGQALIASLKQAN